MAINFEEYRGVRNLVIAKLTETVDSDGNLTATYDAPKQLAGVQAVAGAVNESSETHFYDDMAAIVVDSEGEDTYTLTVSVPTKEMRALVEGTTFDKETGALIGTQKKKNYFALGFIADKINGDTEYNWIYKGKFTGGNKTHNTKTDGTEGTNMEYTFTSIHTTETFEKTENKPCKYLSVDDNGKCDLTDFFQSVVKPDDLSAKAAEN